MIVASLLLALSACGDDSGGPGAIDSAGGGGDSAEGTPDGGADGSSAGFIDASATGGGAGSICVTGAQPGEFGSCMDPLVCCLGDNNTCAEEAECPGGNMYVSCTTTADCEAIFGGGRICCEVPGVMTFCTRNNTCSGLGGHEVGP